MRRILNIGGNDVAFECNAVTPILYKAQFNKDYMSEIFKLNSLQDVLINPNKAKPEDFDKLDFDVFSRLAWAFAKSADKDHTKPYKDWMWENKEFNVIEATPILMEMIQESFETKKK